MSESYTSVVSGRALLGWMEFFTDRDEQLSPANPEPSDIAVFETREFLCILNNLNSFSSCFDIGQEAAALFQDIGWEHTSDRIMLVERF